MTQLLSSQGVDITQKNFQQIIIRGDGKDQFNQIINQEISALPPSKNLEVIINDKFMFAKKLGRSRMVLGFAVAARDCGPADTFSRRNLEISIAT